VLRRVLREQRRFLVLLGAVLAVNVGVYAIVVYPLAGRVADASSRADAAAASRRAAAREFAAARSVATGKERAEAELKTFYEQVLPANVSAARRATYLPLAQLARKDNLRITRMQAKPNRIHDSALDQYGIELSLQGNYEDIRRFIYDVETSTSFVVIHSLEIDQGRETGKPIELRLALSTYMRAADHAS
jgi:Tfp pilus assembly protein PilO